MDNNYVITIILLTLLTIVTIFGYYDNQQLTTKYNALVNKTNMMIRENANYSYQVQNLRMLCDNESLERAESFSKNGSVIEGLAFIDKGYMKVWVNDRTLIEVLETAGHEYYHWHGLTDE